MWLVQVGCSVGARSQERKIEDNGEVVGEIIDWS